VQNKLSKSLDHAKSSVRHGLAAARSRDFDIETGLRTRAHLHADLARLNGIPARVELLALHPEDGLDSALLAGPDAELPQRLGKALRTAAHDQGARAYRLDGTLYAFLGPAEGTALTPAASAQRALEAVSERLAQGVVRGEARMPDEAPDGTSALALAHERLRARSRWQRLSSERQVRDVLLQILSERRAGGSAVALPGVAAHAIGVGRRLGLALGALDDIVRAAEMQDLGMLAVPESVLKKKGTLEPEDWAMIHRHPLIGERILAAAPALTPVARLVRSSYERFDGSGYPDGLRGETIPLGSRVIAVCVAYDAMTSVRPWREPLTVAAAFEELHRCAGNQFDPMVVAAFSAEMGLEDPETAPAASAA
jgi:HD-GYP domain-containing protein (c-di-GMP phosphodiesterase class II)